MSGFAAIVDTDDAVDRRLLRSLLDVSPFDADRAALWVYDGVGLAAAPLRSPGALPAIVARDGLAVVMAGRLDDRVALVDQLQGHLERVPSRHAAVPDVDLVLAAYVRWGAACASHLLGDFAFCLWDAPRRRLICARDHLGVKPLYYARAGSALIVSNVLRSVRRHPAVSDRFDDRAICDVLLAGAVMDQSRTSFADVARVPPAHTMTCAADGATRIDRYWSFQPAGELRLADPHEYVERYSCLLRTVVADRAGAGPVGVMMSGGLDSSSVAVAAADVMGPARAAVGLRAYTVVYDSSAGDQEGRYASLVSQRLGIESQRLAADGYAWFAGWDAGLIPPEPTMEPMTAITADLLEHASRHSAVVLTGDGGDPALLPSTLLGLIGRTPIRVLARDLLHSRWRSRPLPPLGLRAMVRRWLSREEHAPAWLSRSFVLDCNPTARRRDIAEQRAPGRGPRALAVSSVVDPWWTSMFETYDPGAMQRPVELRYPLFDVRMLSFAVSLPTHPWCVNKEIVRRAMSGRLPDEVCTRPKQPLAVDVDLVHGRWDAAEVADAIEALPQLSRYVDVRAFRTIPRPSGRLTSNEPGVWAIVALAAWLQSSKALSVSA